MSALLLFLLVGNWAVAKKFASLNHYSVSASGELVAYGLSNIACAVCNGFVAAGGLARSAVNAEAGSKTPLAGAITGLFILLSVLFLTSLFYYLPMATLGAIIEVSVVSMMDFEGMAKAYKQQNYPDFAIMSITALCTFFIGISYGLLIGVVLSVGIFFYYAAFPTTAYSELQPEPHKYIAQSAGSNYDEDNAVHHAALQEQESAPLDNTPPPYVIVSMTSSLFFANVATFNNAIDSAADELVQLHLSQNASADEGVPQEQGSTDSFDRRNETDIEELLPVMASLAVIIDSSCWGRYLDLPAVNAVGEACSRVKKKYQSVADVRVGLVNVHSDVQLILERSGVLCTSYPTKATKAPIQHNMVFSDVHACKMHCGRILKSSSVGRGTSPTPSLGELCDTAESKHTGNSDNKGNGHVALRGMEVEMVPGRSKSNDEDNATL